MKRGARGHTSSDKTLSIMDLFTPERPEWTIEDMTAELGLSHSTVYRYVRSLVAVGLVFSVRPGRYLLGPGIIHYDRQFRLADPLIQAAQPILRALAGRLEPPGMLFISRVYREHIMSMLEQRLGVVEFVSNYDRGRFMPLYRGAPPLVILAHLPIRNLKRGFLIAHSGNQDAWRQFRRQLLVTRRQGYAVDIGAADAHALYVSVPLFQVDGGVAGSLSLGVPRERGTPRVESIVATLHSAAQQIAQALERTDAPTQDPPVGSL